MRLVFSLLLSALLLFGCDSGPSDSTGTTGTPNLGKGDQAGDVGPNGPNDGLGIEDEAPDGLGIEDEVPDEAGDEIDPLVGYEVALDVTAHHVTFPEGTGFPDTYDWPQGANGFSLGGTEFWQKWSGGESPTFSFTAGSDFGRRCMFASARRWEVIVADPPETLIQVLNDSNWGGSFFNWNDDYANSDWGDGSSARLWAWKTHLIKWISQTNKDGSCYLPTLEMVEALADSCLAKGAEIQGCSAP